MCGSLKNESQIYGLWGKSLERVGEREELWRGVAENVLYGKRIAVMMIAGKIIGGDGGGG